MKWMRMFASVALVTLNCSAQLATSHHPATPATGATTKTAELVPAIVADKPVARVNGVTLTDRDLVREEYAIFPYARQHGGLPKSMAPQIRQGALDMIIFEELVYQEAIRRKYTIPPQEVDRAEAQFKEQFPGVAELREYLKAECRGSRQVLRNRIRRSMMIDKFMAREVSAKAFVTEEDARTYFNNNPKQFQLQESFAIQSISVVPPPDATPAQLADARKRAEEIYKQAKATKSYQDFGLLAEKVSEDDFRVNMGDHRAVGKEKMPPELWAIAETMKPGEISNLVQLGNSFTIFRLNAHGTAGSMKFEEVRERLMSGLKKDKYNQLRSELAKKLRKNARIEIV